MLVEPLLAHAAAKPNEIAVIDDAGTRTWAELAAKSFALAGVIAAHTSKPAIGLLLPSGSAFVASFHGTLLAGKTVVPINFLLGEREIAHVIADSGIDAVVTVPQLAAKVAGAGVKVIDLAALAAAMAARATSESGSGSAIPSGPTSSAGSAPPTIPARTSADIAVIMYTSGTSGLPKGVVLSFGNLDSDVSAAIVHAKLTGHHKFLGVVPLFHSTGMLATMLAPVRLGSTMVYMARFSPLATLAAIREHQISIVTAVPSMYGAVVRLKDAGPADVSSLYAAISGGEPLPVAIGDAFRQKFGVPIYEGYGLTETIGPIAFNVPGAIKPGSVGRLIPTAEAKFVDDDGADLPAGQTGEIWLRGPMVMQGYNNLPAETAAAITPDRFFKTGDIGHIDSDGYLHVTGRKKELIIVAGEKAVPREIEEVLLRHPAVAEAGVVGKKDPSRGEVVAAFVVLREGMDARPEEIRDFVRGQGLPQWKTPREIYIEKDLPRSPTGKVLKRVLKERVEQM